MIKVALLGCKSGAIAPNYACLCPLFIAHFFPCQHNRLCVNKLSLHAQNSRISHQGFLSALSEEYWALEMQILSGKLTDKQEFVSVIRLGRALTKTFLHIPFVGTPFGFMISFGEWALRERCSRHPSSKRYHEWCRSITVPTKEKHKKHKIADGGSHLFVFFFVFSDYGRVLCTNKRLYVRLSRTGSRKT